MWTRIVVQRRERYLRELPGESPLMKLRGRMEGTYVSVPMYGIEGDDDLLDFNRGGSRIFTYADPFAKSVQSMSRT